jgi:hypothetical protein
MAFAFALLSPVEDPDERQARRERRKARRAAMLALARQIFDMHDDGCSAEEIARATGRCSSSIRQFAAARGVVVSRSAVTVRYAIVVSTRDRDSLRKIAADRGATPTKTLGDLVALALGEDAAIARRTLRVAGGRAHA